MAIDTSALFAQRIIQSIGFIGYGNRGKTFATAFKSQTSKGVAWVGAWDILFDDMRDLPDSEMAQAEAIAKRERQHARDRGIAAAGSAKQLCETATLIISCVTAGNTLAAAQGVAEHIKPGTYFLDMNTAAPDTKKACALAIEAARGHYVEVVEEVEVVDVADVIDQNLPRPQSIQNTMRLGGASAEKLATALMLLGIEANVASSVNDASINNSQIHVKG